MEVSFPSDCFRHNTGVSVHLTASSAHLVSCRLFSHLLDSIEHKLTRKSPQFPGLQIHSASEGGAGNLRTSKQYRTGRMGELQSFFSLWIYILRRDMDRMEWEREVHGSFHDRNETAFFSNSSDLLTYDESKTHIMTCHRSLWPYRPTFYIAPAFGHQGWTPEQENHGTPENL